MTKLKLALALAASLLVSPALAQTGQLGAGQVWGNPSAVQSVAVPASISALLDRALGSTRGAILERGASGWGLLGPGATSGLPFVSLGTGADPAYATLTVVGGGTGQNAFTAHCVALGEGTSGLGCVNGSAGNSSLPLISQGSGLDPIYSQIGFSAISGFGTGVAAALGNNVGTAGAPVLFNGAGGTPSSIGLANGTGLPFAGLPAGSSDTVLGYWGITTVGPLAINNCANALTYSTTTHAFGCNSSAGTGTVTSVASGNGLIGGPITAAGTLTVEQMTPGGRITLASGVPVMTTSQSLQTTIYYAPYRSKYVPVYTAGTGMRLLPFTTSDTDTVGQSIAMAGSANWAINSNFDVFAYVNGSSAGICTGPDWSQGAVGGSNAIGSSSRGTGAGSTQLQMFKALLTNQNTMTCRTGASTTISCAVNECTYLGTFRSAATTGQTSFIYGTIGQLGIFFVWNAYNQETFCSSTTDNTASWTYTSATIRQANGSGNNELLWVSGLAGGSIQATYNQTVRPASVVGAFGNIGMAINSTAVFDVQAQVLNNAAATMNTGASVTNSYGGRLGANFIAATESSDGTNATTFIGNNGAPFQKLTVCLPM